MTVRTYCRVHHRVFQDFGYTLGSQASRNDDEQGPLCCGRVSCTQDIQESWLGTGLWSSGVDVVDLLYFSSCIIYPFKPTRLHIHRPAHGCTWMATTMTDVSPRPILAFSLSHHPKTSTRHPPDSKPFPEVLLLTRNCLGLKAWLLLESHNSSWE